MDDAVDELMGLLDFLHEQRDVMELPPATLWVARAAVLSVAVVATVLHPLLCVVARCRR